MTDPDFDLDNENRRERELWAATIDRLREHADDPRAEQGLDRLAAAILAEHRASANPIVEPATRRRRARVIAIASLAAAAAIAVIVLATRSDDSAIQAEKPAPEPKQPSEHAPATEPIPEPTRVGPALDQAGLLTFGIGPVEQVTEVAAAIRPGATIQPGTTLSTTREGEACLRWTAPFALVCVEGNARVELLAAESSTRRVRLHAGRLVAVLDPLAPGQRFEVTTSLGSVAAIGTVFVVDVGEVAIATSVFEGEVEIRDDQGLRRLRADESLRLGAGERPAPLDLDVRARAEALSARAELWRGPIESMGFVEFESAARELDLDGHPLDTGSLALLLTAGAHHLRVGEDGELELDITAGAHQTLGELPTSVRPSKPSAPVERSAAELARLAQQHRMARNYPETARFYRELIDRHPESPEAVHAPVRLGDLLLKTGDHQGALEAYDRYLERGGQLEPEARFGRLEALRALGRREDEKAAIAEFLREHPDDYRVAELEQRRAELE